MPTFLKVRASNRPHAGTYTPGRFWQNDVEHNLEIIPDIDVTKQMDQVFPVRPGQNDPAARALKLAEGPWIKAPDGKIVVDPERISESGAQMVRDNPQASTMEGGGADVEAATAAVGTARLVAMRAQEQLFDANLEIERLRLRVIDLGTALETAEGAVKTASEAYAARGVELDSALSEIAKLKGQDPNAPRQVPGSIDPAPAATSEPAAPAAATEAPAPAAAPATEGKKGKGK